MAQEQDPQDQSVSVFDYLYIDKPRISYLLAQLDSNGVVASHKRLQGLTGTNSGEVKGSLKIMGASASAMESHSETSELHFDASWLLPGNVLDVLNDSSLIKTDLRTAEVGQIVLVSGNLSLFDIDLVKRLWDGMTAYMALEGAGKSSPKAAQAERKKMELAGKVIKDLPPALQLTINDGHDEVWAQLNAQYMTLDPHSMTMKHGPNVQGTWHVVAILDAVPDEIVTSSRRDTAQFIDMMYPLMGGLRNLIGRPATSYGVTPLLLFRTCG
ncbi:hypothetical protein [Stenotrophomonas maltophilia]|uniref:DUF6414 family protein n=1 Tax=Stenotrophomonas maltophilia TaxID=40324 RepID=UPI0039DFBBBE